MQKRILTVLAVAAFVAGCSKSPATTSEQASSAAAASNASYAPVANGAGNGDASKAIVLPVYPGATLKAGSHADISEDSDTLEADSYETKDPAPTVAAWYQAHLPADWYKIIGEPGKKTAGAFTSPSQGDHDGQTVSVIGSAGTDTEIDVSTKTPK